MAIKRVTTTPPPTHPKTKRGRTRHEVTGYQFPLSTDEDAALAHEIDESTVETFLARTEDWARDVLTAAGLPDHLEAVRRDAAGQWFDDLPKGWREKKPADFMKPGETVATVSGLVEDRPHSPEWRAERILRFASTTRHRTQLGDAPGAAWNAIQLMQVLHLAGFKLDLEWPLDVGMRVIESGKHGKKRSREAEHAEWKTVFDDVTGQYPDKSKAEVHRIVAERLEVTEKAVKKALWRLEMRAQT